MSEQQPTTPSKVLRHVVLFAFKDNSTPQQIQQIEQAFRDLPHKIEVIHNFEWGTNVSPENLDQGYTHCFLVTFLSEQDRNTYLPHPAHKEFVTLLEPHLEKVLVIDYWSSR
jgi:hypothetical protein